MSGMQARFHELGAAREAILAQSGPANAVREAIRERIGELERMAAALTVEIKRIEAPLFDIDNERGGLVRALKGKTGEPTTSKAKPMNVEAIAGLIQSMNLGKAVTVQAAAAAGPDPRVDALVDAIAQLNARIDALPKQAAPAFDATPIRADMQAQAAKLNDDSTAVAQIRADLGAFSQLLERANG